MNSVEDIKSEGIRLFQKGDLEAALVQFKTAVAQSQQENDSLAEAQLQNNIGVVYRFQKNYPAAQIALEQAISLYKSHQDVKGLGQAYGNMGDLLARQRKKEEAAHYYILSANTLEDAQAYFEQSQVLRALSLHYLRQGRWIESMIRMEESLTQKPRLGIKGWVWQKVLRFALRLIRGA